MGVVFSPITAEIEPIEIGNKNKNLYDESKETFHGSLTNHVLPKYESSDFGRSDVMEEDLMAVEPGLVYFEFILQDGSFSRGPVDILAGEIDEPKYYLSPTFKFEQRKRIQPAELTGSLKRWIHWISYQWKANSSINVLRKISLSAMVYHTWEERNNQRDESLLLNHFSTAFGLPQRLPCFQIDLDQLESFALSLSSSSSSALSRLRGFHTSP